MTAEALVRELGDKVDLIIQFGSLLYSTPHKYSDLDMVWVPREGSTWEHITVSVDGILIDLYPMHWPTLENMAEFGVTGYSYRMRAT